MNEHTVSDNNTNNNINNNDNSAIAKQQLLLNYSKHLYTELYRNISTYTFYHYLKDFAILEIVGESFSEKVLRAFSEL